MKMLRSNLIIALLAVAALAAGDRGLRAAAPAPSATKPAAETVIYTCPMHPRVQSAKPGACPACHMALVARKVTAAATAPAKVNPSMPADDMGAAPPSVPDPAGMTMNGSGMDMSGTNMKGMGGAGMGNCPMGGCPMGMGNMPSSTGKAVSAIRAASGGGGCGCR